MTPDKILAKVLWAFARADGGATAIMRDLAANRLLTGDERRFAGERLRAEETAHAALSATWARRLGMPVGPRSDPYSAYALRDVLVVRRVADPLLKTAWTLAGLRWNEEQSVRAFPRWVAVMDRLGFVDMARDFRQVVGEEQDHVAFGISVAQRLGALHGRFPASYEHYRQLTARAGAGVLAATFARPLAVLEHGA